MAQITWRNVANTVTGNPAAALSGASSAFASAGVGAQRLLTSNLEAEKLRQAQTTDDALQAIYGKGDLAGIDQGANFGAILKAQQDELAGNAQIIADEANARRSNLLSDELAFNARPEQRAIISQRAERKAELEEAQLSAQVSATEIRGQRLQFDKDQWAETVTQNKVVSEGRKNAQLMYSEFYADGVAEIDADNAETIAAMEAEGATPEDISTHKQALADNRDFWINDFVNDRLPDGYQELIRKSNGRLTAKDLVGTDMGDLIEAGKSISNANAEKVYAAAEARRTRAKSASLNTTKLYNMGQLSDGTWELLGDVDAKANQLSPDDAEEAINSVFKIRGVKPENMDTAELKSILRKVGGNRQAFQSIFQNNGVVDPDDFMDDKINWEVAHKEATDYANSMRGFAESASRVESGQAYVSREEYKRRKDRDGADSIFAEKSEDKGAAIDSAVAAIQTKAEEIKTGADNIIKEFAAIPDSVKQRFQPEGQMIENALGKLGLGPKAGNKPPEDLDAANDAYVQALDALSFLKKQGKIITDQESKATAEEAALKTIFRN